MSHGRDADVSIFRTSFLGLSASQRDPTNSFLNDGSLTSGFWQLRSRVAYSSLSKPSPNPTILASKGPELP